MAPLKHELGYIRVVTLIISRISFWLVCNTCTIHRLVQKALKKGMLIDVYCTG